MGKGPDNPTFGVKVDTLAHHPSGTKIIAQTEAGPIYRMPLKIPCAPVVINEIPEEILELATCSNRTRDRLARTLNFNSRTGTVVLGRPNSSFVARFDGQLYVDHLLENYDHQREGYPNLHTYMREAVDYLKAEQIDPESVGDLTSVLSGHIAPINISTREIAYVMLLDKFARPDSYSEMSPRYKDIIHALSASRILTISQNGHIISPIK